MLLLVVIMAIAIAYVWTNAFSAAFRITPRAFNRIKEGMTREEVTAAIGLQPGNYRTRELAGDERFAGLSEQAGWGADWWPIIPRPEGSTCERWFGDDYFIQVEFGPPGVAKAALLFKTEWVSQWPVLDRVKERLGW
jgi:hypothetical protein